MLGHASPLGMTTDTHLPSMRQIHKLLPGDISPFSGEVIGTDHVEEVSGQTVNGSGSTWTDVHRELWIRPKRGTERRFTFTNVTVPARQGHQVTLLLAGGRPLAIVNFSTEQYLNLVTPRHFELFGAAEAFAFAALLVVSVGMQNSPLVGIEFSPPIIDREIADGRESSGGRGSYRRTG